MAGKPRSPVDSFVRHLWLSFGVFSLAVGLWLWWCSAAPWSPDERGDRGLVGLVPMVLWVFGLFVTLFCSYSARRFPEGEGSMRFWKIVFWVGAILSMGSAAAEILPNWKPDALTANEWSASQSLKTLMTAEADFRGNDRDGNGVNDYWVGDVSMLYCMAPPKGESLRLIELSVASADLAPMKARSQGHKTIEGYAILSSKAGYNFRAVTHYVDEKGQRTAYDAGGGRNKERFGFCAVSVSRSAGKKTFLMNESNLIYWKDTNGTVVDTFPADLLKEGWTKLD
jgi:hypothetical protein